MAKDITRIQQLNSSLLEGELILRTNHFNGRRLSVDELAAIKRSVESTKRKLNVCEKD